MRDEAGRLEATVLAIAASELATDDLELVLVDDGSTDGTAELADRLLVRHGLAGQVIRLGRNLGKGGAVRAGVAAALGSTIVFVDADLSSPVEAVAEAFDLIEAGKADVVVGTRVHPDASITAAPPLGRRWSGKAFNLLLRGLGLARISDTQCGLKGFDAGAAAILFTDLRIRRFAFDVELLFRAERGGLTILELPHEWSHVEASRVRALRDGSRMVFDVLRLRVAARGWTPPTAPGAMDAERFEVMAAVERDHWWFRTKRRLVIDHLGSRVAPGPVADVGCGTGALLADLRGAGYGPVVGTDLSEPALGLATEQHPGVAQAVAEHLPYADRTLAAVTALDVLEHLDDDVAALRELGRVLRPGGVVVLTVPAYRWAWSDHDVALGHRRRYTVPSLRAVAMAAGLDVEHVGYFHSWLVPVALLVRRTPIGRLLRGSAEEASFVSPRVNRLLVTVSGIERAVIARVPVPFGLSVLLVARRRPGR
jgi:SAM-dependent methyltransferase